VGSVEPSRFDAGTAYVAFDFHQVGGFDPHLYKTTDYGRTWKKIVRGIPPSPLSYTHVLREDTKRKGLLYAGTENAVYVSFDDGEQWMPLQLDLPHAPVHWIDVQPHFHDLVIGTYGRGIYILDDLTPLQQLTTESGLEAGASLSLRGQLTGSSRRTGATWLTPGPRAGRTRRTAQPSTTGSRGRQDDRDHRPGCART
jgi:hypothetical protein